MKRIILMVLKYFFIAPIWVLQIYIYGHSKKYTEDEKFLLLKKITTKVNKAGRVKIEAHGLENLPEKNGYIMYPNHQGLFDVLAFLETDPMPFTVIMKKEVSSVFLVKQVFELLRAKAIDREDVRQSMKIIMEVADEVANGRNYIIFPEGTRSKNKNNLLEFKGGSFKSAMIAKCPIVPVALIDSYKAFDTNSIEKVKVVIVYLKAIYYDEYKDMKSTEIAKMVKERIYEAIANFDEQI